VYYCLAYSHDITLVSLHPATVARSPCHHCKEQVEAFRQNEISAKPLAAGSRDVTPHAFASRTVILHLLSTRSHSRLFTLQTLTIFPYHIPVAMHRMRPSALLVSHHAPIVCTTVDRRTCSPSVDHHPHVLLRGRRRSRRQPCLPLADVLRLAVPFRSRRLRLALRSPRKYGHVRRAHDFRWRYLECKISIWKTDTNGTV